MSESSESEWWENKPQEMSYVNNGFSVIVAANCPDISFGMIVRAVMEAINEPVVLTTGNPEDITIGTPSQRRWWKLVLAEAERRGISRAVMAQVTAHEPLRTSPQADPLPSTLKGTSDG